MSLLFERAAAALEREELVVSDARQALSRTPTGADLHAAIESDVVDDVDAGEGEVGIGGVAVAPFTGGATPRAVSADSPSATAEGAGAGECMFGRHRGRLRAPSDTAPLLPGARRA